MLQTQQGQRRIKKKHRIRLHHSCQRYGWEKEGGQGPQQGHREKRTGQEKSKLEEIHEILKGRRNKEIKLRLAGEEKESTESIGN